ncbi:MAG: hypothetical protein Mars2KO_14290 [Maribacter sp.]
MKKTKLIIFLGFQIVFYKSKTNKNLDTELRIKELKSKQKCNHIMDLLVLSLLVFQKLGKKAE